MRIVSGLLGELKALPSGASFGTCRCDTYQRALKPWLQAAMWYAKAAEKGKA